MRAPLPLFAITLILTFLVVGCSAPGVVGPEGAVERTGAGRELDPAGDPCDPNLTPC